jgi:hypothetical protein
MVCVLPVLFLSPRVTCAQQKQNSQRYACHFLTVNRLGPTQMHGNSLHWPCQVCPALAVKAATDAASCAWLVDAQIVSAQAVN